MSKIKDVIGENKNIFDYLDQQTNRTYSYWQILKNAFSGQCFSSGKKARKGCYIMTIGVIDECRKLGIGTMLLTYHADRLR